MYYFFPSWYSHDKKWAMRSKPWYEQRIQLEFDDTLSLLQLFQQSEEQVRLCLLNYQPHLRYFLNQHGLLNVQYQSVFDQLQGVGEVVSKVLSLADFEWSVQDEFFYSPFVVLIQRNHRLFARVDFDQAGNILWISYFDADEIVKQLVVDDRGFISSIIYYEQGQPLYQEYLNLAGIWQLREWYHPMDAHVEVNATTAFDFKHRRYDNMTAVVAEVVQVWKSSFQAADCVVIASDDWHNELLLQDLRAKKVLSLFSQRPYQLTDKLLNQLDNCELVVMDVQQQAKVLQERLANPAKVQLMTLFDTRLALGMSQRQSQMEIMVVMDELTLDQLHDLIFSLLPLMLEDKRLELVLVAYSQEAKLETLLQEIEPYLAELTKSEPSMMADALTMSQPKLQLRIRGYFIRREQELLQQLNRTRVVIDLASAPHTFTQMRAISAGVPQINVSASDYVQHLKNGYIATDLSEVVVGVQYFTQGLKHWNESLIYSVQLIEKYATESILAQWKNRLVETNDGKKT